MNLRGGHNFWLTSSYNRMTSDSTPLPPPPLLFSISGELARRASIYAVWFRFFEFDGGTNLSRVSFL